VIGRLEDLTDAELLARADREPEAFAAFYRRHVGWVLRVAARRTRSPEHAGDLTAEVFAAAMLAARRFRPERPNGEANTWLFAILLHKLAGFERRGAVERRGRRALRLETPALTEEEFDRLTDEDDRAPAILAQLERLQSDQRDAVRARVIDERPYAEVAATLRISEANARQRVSRGLAAIRTAFQKETS
jgi:RNA polymerase sigma-70 factor (ECF subfamily)